MAVLLSAASGQLRKPLPGIIGAAPVQPDDDANDHGIVAHPPPQRRRRQRLDQASHGRCISLGVPKIAAREAQLAADCESGEIVVGDSFRGELVLLGGKRFLHKLNALREQCCPAGEVACRRSPSGLLVPLAIGDHPAAGLDNLLRTGSPMKRSERCSCSEHRQFRGGPGASAAQRFGGELRLRDVVADPQGRDGGLQAEAETGIAS